MPAKYKNGFSDGIDAALALLSKYKAGHYIVELLIRDLQIIKKKELTKKDY